LISVKFSSVFMMFQCGASGQSLLASGRVELSRPDGIRLRPKALSNQRPDGKDNLSGRARPVLMVPRQCASGRHYFTVRTGTPQAL
jgi:hypothetical protein